MSNYERLIRSIREVSKNVEALEARMNNLDHPIIGKILDYQEGLDSFGSLGPKKRSDLIFGKMTDRLDDMSVRIEKLETMLLELIERERK